MGEDKCEWVEQKDTPLEPVSSSTGDIKYSVTCHPKACSPVARTTLEQKKKDFLDKFVHNKTTAKFLKKLARKYKKKFAEDCPCVSI